MKTKTVHLKTGDDVTLYFIESLQEWTANDKRYRFYLTNFERFMDGESGCSLKMEHTIKRYYECENTTLLNKSTIKRMINESLNNIPVIYDMLLTSSINRKRG
jgi:hypothetical protein